MTGIERLRDFARHMKDFSVWPGGQKLLDIADQIERENIEETEAAAWVRKHGGLDSVKKLLDWVVGHCSTRQQLDFDFWLSGRVMYELGFEEDMADRDEVERRLLARLMPEGMEWPRFEDGEPVRFGDELLEFANTIYKDVKQIKFRSNGCVVIDNAGGSAERELVLWNNERVKRPAPKVLDADGAEIREGDTVWGTNGHGPFEVTRIVYADRLRVIADDEKNGHLNAYPEMLTHRAPVLAADDKPLEAGQTVWSIEDGGPYKVDAPLSVDCYGVRLLNGRTPFRRSPDTLTHQRPVLDADGVPIKVGDVVWSLTDGRKHEVTGIDPIVKEIRIKDESMELGVWVAACGLTHTKPEPPDSWERLEEDVSALIDENLECTVSMQDYVDERGVKCPHGILYLGVVQDVLRRAKALTERGR